MERIPMALLTRPMSGGMKKHILQLLSELDERFAIHLLGPEDLSGEVPHKPIQYFPVHLKENLNPLDKAPQLVHLCRYFRRNKIRLLHCHGVQAALIGRIAAAMTQTPAVVCTFHNLVYDRPYQRWQKKLYVAGNRLLNLKTSYLITVSEALKRQLISEEGIAAEKVRVIYNGLEKTLFTKSTPGETQPRTAAKPLVGMVGRLVPEKGVDLFLEAIHLVLKTKPETEAWIVGDGPKKEELIRQCQRLGLSGKVKFWGYVPDPINLIKSLDVIVVPSRSEGLSIVTLEAMAQAKPVVAFAAGALPEVVVHDVTGVLVPPFDIRALANAILRLLDDEGLRLSFGNNGYTRAKEYFTLERMIKETETVYYQALNEPFVALEG